MKTKLKIYALYKGDDLLGIGTIKELSEELRIKESTVRYYLTPAHQKKLDSQKKKPKNARKLVCLGYDDE